MSWTSAIADIRNQLADNPTNKHRYRKRCVGQVDGTNTTFKTFEIRRVNDFTTATAPIGVYVNGVHSAVTADFTEVGEFVLSAAPADGSVVEATYYVQWFIDSELDGFVTQASEWLGLGSSYVNIPDGLRPAAKFYACKQACEFMALRWAEQLSDTYLFQDAPRTDQRSPVDDFRKLAETYYKQAQDARKGFYSRQDQNEAPLFSSISGAVFDVTPKR